MNHEAPGAASKAHTDESLLQALTDQAPTPIAACAIDGIYLFANAAYARALGTPIESIVGHRGADILGGAPIPAPLRVCCEPIEPVEHGAANSADEEAEVDGRRRRFLTTRFPLRTRGGDVFAIGLIAAELGTPAEAGSDPQCALVNAEAHNADLRRALEQMERLAYTDRLTGAWNRRHLDDAAVIEMSRAERHGHPVSILIADIDHFKELNDRLGHAAGDRVLVEIVRCIRNDVRRADSVTRWGGEEFVVLAPDTPLHEAERLAAKLCARVAASEPTCEATVTVSIGVAEYQCGEGFESWLGRADRAMYRAKQGGRNRCESDPQTVFGTDGGRRIPQSLLQLVWRDSYRCGEHGIDEQHRRLFEHANRLLDAVLASAARERVLEATRELIDEISAHFRAEERLHAEIGYPDRDGHAAEHVALLRKAERLAAMAERDALPAADLFQFLAYEVIAQHLLGTDRRYYPYLGTAAAADSSPVA